MRLAFQQLYWLAVPMHIWLSFKSLKVVFILGTEYVFIIPASADIFEPYSLNIDESNDSGNTSC